ncbi:hypothetical protein [Nannocystis punicea]|uniref:Phytanoyl-CoA dioxygenase family protein n=1 Tax=Nannocystis punicea TaxID=2995304 RepID=A0ABY7GX44_9BACT|nr:hypothetical protein [Nannocystis poenicansa]WAS91516.1 hypothetical protein O0S08_35485 [Nannocystis poenicansa]
MTMPDCDRCACNALTVFITSSESTSDLQCVARMRQLLGAMSFHRPVPTPEEVARFRRRGLIKIDQLMSPSEIEALRNGCMDSIWTPDDPKGLPGFANIAFTPRQTVFDRIAGDESLRSLLRALVGERLIFTTGNRFSLEPGATGSPWHFGRLTFCSIQPLELGYSLWIPLDPIDTRRQHGGMVWVPTDAWDARGRFQLWAGHIRRGSDSAVREQLEVALRAQFGGKSGFPMLGPYDREFLELHAETADFAVGDAFLFNKFVWHRTEPLRVGEMQQRVAVVLRFVSEDATLARDLMLAATSTMDEPTRRAQGIFGSFLHDIDDGALLRSSSFCPAPL